MNYSTAVFLINSDVRCVAVSYEADDKPERWVLFKTFDKDICKDDLVVVPTNTRHNFTVCKVMKTDVDVDFDSSVQMQWIVDRVHMDDHKAILAKEEKAIETVKGAELKRKKDELRDAIFAKHQDDLRTLELASPDVKPSEQGAPPPDAV